MRRPWTEADAGIPAYIDHDSSRTSSFGLIGGEVDTWTNRGSLGGVATAIGAGNRFQYIADAGDGLPAVRSSGSDQLLSDSRIILVPGARILAVVRANGTSGIHRYLAQGQNGFPENVTGLIARVNEGVFEVATEASSPAIRTTTVYRPTGGIGWALVESSDLGFILNNGINYRISGHLGGEYWDGDIARIVMLHPDTSADDAARWRGRLAWDRQLQSGLPSDDPFRYEEPWVDDGTTAPIGDLAATLDPIVIAATAALPIVGIAGTDIAPVLASGRGGLSIVGNAAITIGPVVATATGAIRVAGHVATSVEAIGIQSAGSLPIAGSALIALAPVVASSAGQAAVAGRVVAVLEPIAVQATSGAPAPLTGSVAVQLASIVSAAAGTNRITGQVMAAVQPISASGAGATTIAGRLSVVIGPVTGAGAGVLPVAGRVSSMIAAVTLVSAGEGESGPIGPIVIPPRNRFVIPARQRRFAVPRRQRSFLIRKGTCMSSITKYAAEERQYQADWSADLNGQTIAGDIVPSSNDPTLIVDRVTYDGPVMKFWVRGGTSGKVATIRFVAPTSGGEDLAWQQTVVVY